MEVYGTSWYTGVSVIPLGLTTAEPRITCVWYMVRVAVRVGIGCGLVKMLGTSWYWVRDVLLPSHPLPHTSAGSFSCGPSDIVWLSTDNLLAAAAVVSGLVVAHRTNPQRSAEGFTSGPPTAH